MCFAPWVSLTTAIIEFLVATFILLYYRKNFLNRSAAVFVYILGIYQFSEFLLCTSTAAFFWARVGFAVYTFLPALSLYFALRYTHHHPKIYSVFILPVAFSIFAFMHGSFILSATCQKVFILVTNILFPVASYWPISILYWWIYYFGFVAYASYLIYTKYLKDKDKIEKKEDEFIFLASGLVLFGAFAFVVTVPALYLQFPSIYCQFAIFFTIISVLVAEMDRRKNLSRKVKRR